MKLTIKMNVKALSRRRASAFTLAEVIMAISISAVAFSGVIRCYTQCTRRAQWSGYSLAAQAVANKELEQARAAVWDDYSGNNEITNLNLTGWTYNATTKKGSGRSTATLDLPVNGTNAVMCTNFVSVRMIDLSTTPAIRVQMVRVDTVWSFKFGGTRVYTNSVANYYAPDNRGVEDL
jgi:Tfp pilus assembly protein PilV